MFFYAYVFVDLFRGCFCVYLVQKKPKEASALKGVSGTPGQCPHPKHLLNHFEQTQLHRITSMMVQVFPT